jgi:hypothetical protein
MQPVTEPARPVPPPPHLSRDGDGGAPALAAASSAPHARAEERWQPPPRPPPSAPPLQPEPVSDAALEEMLARASVTSACPPGRQSTYQADAFSARRSSVHVPPSAPPYREPPAPLPSAPPLRVFSYAPEPAVDTQELAALRDAAARLEQRAQALFLLRTRS